MIGFLPKFQRNFELSLSPAQYSAKDLVHSQLSWSASSQPEAVAWY